MFTELFLPSKRVKKIHRGGMRNLHTFDPNHFSSFYEIPKKTLKSELSRSHTPPSPPTPPDHVSNFVYESHLHKFV
jgi:hypothetical protein